ARDARPDAEDARVEAVEVVGAHVDAEAELDALVGELRDPALDDVLLDLEVRDAEAQQTAAGLVPLEQGHRMSGAIELLRAGETRRARAHDGDRAAGALARRLGDDPALLPRAVDNRELDLLDRDRVALLDLEHARGLARRRAE